MANNTIYNCTDSGTPDGSPFLGVILNTDGTVYGLTGAQIPSGQYGNTPTEAGTQLVAECCDAYATALLSLPPSDALSNYSFMWDEATQQCRWSSPCNLDSGAYKLILSPEQNDGALFDVDENETCYLEISFDYIMLFDCSTLINCAGENCDVISILSGISLDTTIEMVTGQTSTPPIYFQSPTTLETVHTQTFFDIAPDFVTYLTNNTNTGFLFTGDCESTINCILNGLGDNCNIVSANTFNSSWVHYSYVLSEPEILTLIQNQRIKLGIQINGCSCNFSLLLDNIKINKVCTKVEKTNMVVNTSPGFSLTRQVDNKKAWVYTGASQTRQYDLLMRDTSYFTNHSKLVINTKEVEINLDGAAAIECNVYDFITNTDCINSSQICLGYETVTTVSGGTSGHTTLTFTNQELNGVAGWTAVNFVQSGPWAALTSTSGSVTHDTLVLEIGATYQGFFYFTSTGTYDISVSLGTNTYTIPGVPPFTNVQFPIYWNPLSPDGLMCTGGTAFTISANYISGTAGFKINNAQLYKYYITGQTSSTTVTCTADTMVSELLSTPMSSITNAQEFVNVIQTELIDVKDRKVLSAYPVLRYIYDSYNDPSSIGCTADSRSYNYCMLSRFMDLIGSYWVDIIEQVIPATTIWGSTYVYRNTIFDQPKFKYKRGTLFYCLKDDALPDTNCSIIGYVTGKNYPDAVAQPDKTFQIFFEGVPLTFLCHYLQ